VAVSLNGGASTLPLESLQIVCCSSIAKARLVPGVVARGVAVA
jgi:hypothetical protein